MFKLVLRSLFISSSFLFILINFLYFSGASSVLSPTFDTQDYSNYYFGFSSIYTFVDNNPFGNFMNNYTGFIETIRSNIQIDFTTIKELANRNWNLFVTLFAVVTILISVIKSIFLLIVFISYIFCFIAYLIVGLFNISVYATPMPSNFVTL